MDQNLAAHLGREIERIRAEGLYKAERQLSTPQGAHVRAEGLDLLNLCANNYLGLANHPTVVETAREALLRSGYGMASVRFICGTTDQHRQLEKRIAGFLGFDDSILYASCFDANGGLFETLLGQEDAIISDSLNHASIIDGVRLSKARRLVYANNNMEELATRLKEARDCRFRLIATDGVFSMDGTIANLGRICALAEEYDAVVMVDDSHAVGFLGEHGRGTHEYRGVMGKVDIMTGTLGKALGGGLGGYTAGKKNVVEYLRQRSRPYLFSNSLPPPIVAASLAVLEALENGDSLRKKLWQNTAYFRERMTKLGFQIIAGEHPIVPVMIGDAALANQFSAAMLKHGVYVIGFSFPVVPRGMARIRTQVSAALSRDDLDKALLAFETVGRELKLIA